MKKQTSVYLSEADWERIEKLQTKYEIKSAGKLIRLLLKTEYEKIKTLERQE